MILNRVFSKNSVDIFLAGKLPTSVGTVIRRNIINPDEKTNEKVISEIYHFMDSNYRNEYFYKNTLLNKLLIHNRKHNFKNTTALSEIPICRAKADLVLINGQADVYEIKTDLDNLDKLQNQIREYYKAFDHVNVVTCKEKKDMLQELEIPSKVGIYVLSKSNRLKMIKESQEEKTYLEHKAIFKILRKQEYENILRNYFGNLPICSRFDYYKECLKMFQQIDIEQVYSLSLLELKQRCHIEIKQFKMVPNTMKSLVYFSNMEVKDIESLNSFFASEYRRENVLSIS
jgi:hypothetical protein